MSKVNEIFTEYLLDSLKLTKGSFLSDEKLEELLSFKREGNSQAFSMARTQIVGIVDKYLKKRDGIDYTIKIVTPISGIGCGIEILTDIEAFEHNPASFDSGMRRAKKSLKKFSGIDENNLTREQQIEKVETERIMRLRLESEIKSKKLKSYIK